MSNYRVITDLEDKRKMIILDKDEKDFSESDIEYISSFISTIITFLSRDKDNIEPIEKFYIKWKCSSLGLGDYSNMESRIDENTSKNNIFLNSILVFINSDICISYNNTEDNQGYYIIENYFDKYGKIVIDYINKNL